MPETVERREMGSEWACPSRYQERAVALAQNDKPPVITEGLSLVPKIGIEPTTFALRKRCSTAELLGRAGRQDRVLSAGFKQQLAGPAVGRVFAAGGGQFGYRLGNQAGFA